MKIYLIIFVLSVVSCSNINLDQNTEPQKKPSQVLDLSKWYLTIPFDNSSKDGENSEVAAVIYQPLLSNYVLPPYFRTNTENNAVLFRAHCGGAHTPNSGYARSELREMTGKFDSNQKPIKAAWSSTSGRHVMEIKQAILKLPTKSPRIVIGQIHDDSIYLIFFRLEGKKLFVRYNDNPDVDAAIFTDNYTLGTVFTVKFIVENGKTECYYNGEKKFTYNKEYSNAYFKAGAYTQSACWGKSKVEGENCDDYGEVAIYQLNVSHSPEL